MRILWNAFTPYLSNIMTVKQTQECWWQLNNAGCRTFPGTLLYKSPTGLLTKARQQLMILFGAFSTMVQDRYMDTAEDRAPTFTKKTTKKIRVVIWSPQSITCVLELEKQKVENTDCNELKELEKVGEEWHGIRVRSLGLGWQGRCIERASTGPSTYNVLWCHSLNDFRISVCVNK